MKSKIFKIIVNKEIDEVKIVETALTFYYSNNRNTAIFILSTYALAKKWNYDKLIYYLNLMPVRYFPEHI